MGNFIARWFTPPSKKTPSQPGQAQRQTVTPALAPEGRKRKKTRTRYAGSTLGARTADEAEVARKTLLGE